MSVGSGLITHVKVLELLKSKLPNLKLLYTYNDTYHSEAGDKIADNWAFTYEISGRHLKNTFQPDTLDELEKQKKISKILGFSKEAWQEIVDECGD